MKTQHTPGPWGADEKPNDEGFLCIGPEEQTVCIANKWVFGPICEVYYFDFRPEAEAMTKANIALITAAPDLLAALQQVAERLDRWARFGIARGPAGKDADWPTLTTQIHDAIAKAKGEQ